MGIRYRYRGQGTYYTGIPARDLTDEDMAALSDEERTIVATSSIYQAVPASTVKTEMAREE